MGPMKFMDLNQTWILFGCIWWTQTQTQTKNGSKNWTHVHFFQFSSLGLRSSSICFQPYFWKCKILILYTSVHVNNENSINRVSPNTWCWACRRKSYLEIIQDLQVHWRKLCSDKFKSKSRGSYGYQYLTDHGFPNSHQK